MHGSGNRRGPHWADPHLQCPTTTPRWLNIDHDSGRGATLAVHMLSAIHLEALADVLPKRKSPLMPTIGTRPHRQVAIGQLRRMKMESIDVVVTSFLPCSRCTYPCCREGRRFGSQQHSLSQRLQMVCARNYAGNTADWRFPGVHGDVQRADGPGIPTVTIMSLVREFHPIPPARLGPTWGFGAHHPLFDFQGSSSIAILFAVGLCNSPFIPQISMSFAQKTLT